MVPDRGSMNFVIPATLRQRAHHAEQILSDGLASNDPNQFVVAALEYQSILTDPNLTEDDPYHCEIQSSLGAILCLIAQNEPAGPKSLDYLARAQTLLTKSLEHCQKTATPLTWARIRANLSIVYLTRYEQTKASAELLTALMSLDGVGETFAQAADMESEAWVHAISERLDVLKSQRVTRRDHR